MSMLALADNTDSLFFRSGKYYVVIGVLGIIFLGIIIYLIRLDMKLGKLENNDQA